MTVSGSSVQVNGAPELADRAFLDRVERRANGTLGMVDHQRINPRHPTYARFEECSTRAASQVDQKGMECGPGTRSFQAVEAMGVGPLRQRGGFRDAEKSRRVRCRPRNQPLARAARTARRS
jgi:hypothetical protein